MIGLHNKNLQLIYLFVILNDSFFVEMCFCFFIFILANNFTFHYYVSLIALIVFLSFEKLCCQAVQTLCAYLLERCNSSSSGWILKNFVLIMGIVLLSKRQHRTYRYILECWQNFSVTKVLFVHFLWFQIDLYKYWTFYKYSTVYVFIWLVLTNY